MLSQISEALITICKFVDSCQIQERSMTGYHRLLVVIRTNLEITENAYERIDFILITELRKLKLPIGF